QKYYQYADGHTMNNFIGLNEAGAIPYYLVTNVSGLQRDYADQYYLDTSHVHDINKVNFVFDKFSANSTTVSYYFPSGTNGEAGTKQYYTYPNGLDSGMYKGSGIDGNPPYFLPALQSVNQMESDSGWKRSIDYTVHPNADSTNPGSYDRFSRMAWMLGAAFGSNKYPMDSLQYTIPANNISGLDNMSYVETGNENDGDWLGADTWYSPQAFIAYSSAFYDGNDGLMGSRMGIKNSDPNIKVVMAGNAYEYYDYLRTMRYWSYYSRPDHKIPFDVYNFHDYNYIPNTPHSAFQPENYNRLGYSNIRSYWQTVVDSAHEVCPRCDVWETEWGYDRNSNLTNAVPFVPGQDSAEVQGNWVARSWIMQSFVKGLGASFYYMFANANGFHYDSGAYNNYSTCGLIDGSIYGNPCCSINAYAFPAYYYQSTIFHVLNNYIPDSIIYENGVSDSIYEYRYRNASYPDSVAYVVWSGTVSNKRDTLNMNMGSNAVRIQLEDKYLNGEMTAMHPDSTGNILLFISETPQIILSLKGADQGVLSKPVVPTVNSPTTTIYKLTFKQIIDVNGKIEVIFTDPSTGKNYGYILPLN
ncbi:MAG: hypothetical protein ACRDE2_00230, partial [Chitinophagaceae bacterium]